MSAVRLHPHAVVSKKAQLGVGVEIGAYSTIGDNVIIGDGTAIRDHVIVDRNTEIGKNCQLFPFSSVGTDPQDITFRGEETFTHIGDHNIIREFTTINRGTQKGGGHTRIGDHNYFMAYVHIGHDCQVGNHTIFTNGATLAGHVEIGDNVVLSAFCAVVQFARIGRNAYIGGYTLILQDVLPYAKISQKRNTYSFYGPNSIGMMRNGFNRKFIDNVADIFKIIFRSDLNTTQAIRKIEELYLNHEEARTIIDFINGSRRGILKNFQFDE